MESLTATLGVDVGFMGDGDQLMGDGIEGTEDIEALPPGTGFAKQAFKAPQKAERGTEDKMRGIDKENGSLTDFCLLQPGF